MSFENFDEKQFCEALSKNLPVFRKKLGVSQEEMAHILGLSRQTIANIETGRLPMKWSVFLACMFVFYFNEETRPILEKLNIPYDELRIFIKREMPVDVTTKFEHR